MINGEDDPNGIILLMFKFEKGKNYFVEVKDHKFRR